jgi:hypothetical protein
VGQQLETEHEIETGIDAKEAALLILPASILFSPEY